MKVTLAQLNPTVGDVAGNLRKVMETLAQYGGATDLIVFSELFLVGYPPRDLLENPSLIRQVPGRVAHQKQLREDDEVGGATVSIQGLQDFPEIAGDVPHGGI